MVHPRIQELQDKFSQDWEVYMVLAAEPPLATYVELDTICNTEDLHNMLEIMEAKATYIEVGRIIAEQNRPK